MPRHETGETGATFDVYVTCDPDEMPDRLKAAGFVDIRVERADVDDPELGWARSRFLFVATAP